MNLPEKKLYKLLQQFTPTLELIPQRRHSNTIILLRGNSFSQAKRKKKMGFQQNKFLTCYKNGKFYKSDNPGIKNARKSKKGRRL